MRHLLRHLDLSLLQVLQQAHQPSHLLRQFRQHGLQHRKLDIRGGPSRWQQLGIVPISSIPGADVSWRGLLLGVLHGHQCVFGLLPRLYGGEAAKARRAIPASLLRAVICSSFDLCLHLHPLAGPYLW